MCGTLKRNRERKMNVCREIYVVIRIINVYFHKKGGKRTTRIGGKVLIFVTGIFN
jgi:hypothetical protein